MHWQEKKWLDGSEDWKRVHRHEAMFCPMLRSA